MPARRMLNLAAIVAALTVADASRAGLIILGNLPAINDNFGATVDANTAISIEQAVSFTTSATDYPILRVALRLQDYNTTQGDVAEVAIHLDNGSDLPGARVEAMFSSPPSNSVAVEQFEFIPTSPLVLAATTKYWLVVDAAAGHFSWQGSNPGSVPMSSVGVIVGRQASFVNGMPREVPNYFSSFEIVSSIPEPSTGIIGLWSFVFIFAMRDSPAKLR